MDAGLEFRPNEAGSVPSTGSSKPVKEEGALGTRSTKPLTANADPGAAKVTHVPVPSLPTPSARQENIDESKKIVTDFLQLSPEDANKKIKAMSPKEKLAFLSTIQNVITDTQKKMQNIQERLKEMAPKNKEYLSLAKMHTTLLKLHSTVKNIRLLREIDDAKDAMHLAKIARGIAQATGHTKSAGAASAVRELPRLGTTLNPVTKLEPEVHFKKEQVVEKLEQLSQASDTVDIDRQSVRRAFQEALNTVGSMIDESGLHSDIKKTAKAENQQKVGQLFKRLIPEGFGEGLRDGKEMDAQEELQLVMDEIKRELPSVAQNKYQTELIKQILEQLAKLDPSIHLEKVPILYQKDALISNLRLQLLNVGKPEHRARILNIIEIISKVNRNFISADFFRKITSQFIKNASPQDYPLVKALTQPRKDLIEYVSSEDIKMQNPGKEARVTAMSESASPSFAFKLGEENVKEIAGGKVAKSLGLNTYLLTKTEQTVPGARLLTTQNPTGIGSKWVAGRDFPFKKWHDWLQVKQEMVAAQRKGTVSAELEKKYNTLRKEILDIGGIKSIGQHIATDMVLGAGDSHIAQYKQAEDGQMHNFDFSRFFAPHPAFTEGEQTFVTLRSDFLDHPIADEPISDMSPFKADLMPLKEQMLAWDCDAIEADWKKANLIGDPEVFEAKMKEKLELEKDFGDLKSGADYKKLCDKYGVKYTAEQSESEIKQTLENVMRQKHLATKADCWKKLDPKAVQEWKVRTKRMQEYLRTSPAPTLKGAWRAFYSDLAIFSQVLERFEPNPGTALALRHVTKEEEQQEQYEMRQEKLGIGEQIQSHAEKERAKYQLQLKDGSFTTEAGGILGAKDSDAHPYIFVLGRNNKFYIGAYDQEKCTHASLSAEEGAQSAGRFIFNKEGKLEEITDDSGPYKPDARMIVKGLLALKEQGVDLSCVKFTRTAHKKTIPSAAKLLDELQAEIEKERPPIKARTLEDIIFQAKKQGCVDRDEAALLEASLAQVRACCPTAKRAVMGTPGI